jgi:hypothetical protein
VLSPDKFVKIFLIAFWLPVSIAATNLLSIGWILFSPCLFLNAESGAVLQVISFLWKILGMFATPQTGMVQAGRGKSIKYLRHAEAMQLKPTRRISDRRHTSLFRCFF